jgi:hypothetical protein
MHFGFVPGAGLPVWTVMNIAVTRKPVLCNERVSSSAAHFGSRSHIVNGNLLAIQFGENIERRTKRTREASANSIIQIDDERKRFWARVFTKNLFEHGGHNMGFLSEIEMFAGEATF